MSDLSPAGKEHIRRKARAVIDAAQKAMQNPRWQTNFYSSYAAAIIRAAADQVVPVDGGSRRQCNIRLALLAIAAELEANQ